MSSFDGWATVSCSTQRKESMADGKSTGWASNLTGLLCTPLDPVDPELQERLELDTPLKLLQTFIDGDVDIISGDRLVVSGTEYPVKSVAEWTWGSSKYLHLVVEDLRK